MKPTIGKVNHNPQPWSWKKAYDVAFEELKDQSASQYARAKNTIKKINTTKDK